MIPAIGAVDLGIALDELQLLLLHVRAVHHQHQRPVLKGVGIGPVVQLAVDGQRALPPLADGDGQPDAQRISGLGEAVDEIQRQRLARIGLVRFRSNRAGRLAFCT